MCLGSNNNSDHLTRLDDPKQAENEILQPALLNFYANQKFFMHIVRSYSWSTHRNLLRANFPIYEMEHLKHQQE